MACQHLNYILPAKRKLTLMFYFIKPEISYGFIKFQGFSNILYVLQTLIPDCFEKREINRWKLRMKRGNPKMTNYTWSSSNPKFSRSCKKQLLNDFTLKTSINCRLDIELPCSTKHYRINIFGDQWKHHACLLPIRPPAPFSALCTVYTATKRRAKVILKWLYRL